jgi:small subunit ribosomal protein S4
MLKKHKKFNRPKKPFDTERIQSENAVVVKFGLKNKREIWKAKTKLDSIRKRAKQLVNESSDVQWEFIEKLNKLGFKVETVVDVLALTEEDILKRRLQSILIEKKLATTPKGARQLVTHKHVKVNGVVVNIPSYMVSVNEEDKIELKSPRAKAPEVVPAKESPSEEVSVEEAPVEGTVSESPKEEEQKVEPKVEMEVAPAQ